jgi:uncharacterized GH25 family protein
MTTQVNVEVKVQIGAEEKIISREERAATWNEQEQINKLYTKLGEEYTTAQEREDQVVQYALNVIPLQERHPEEVQDYLSLKTIVRLLTIASCTSVESALRKMHREGKLGKWL